MPELNQFIGQRVEIIIITEPKEQILSDENSILKLKGALRKAVDGLTFQKKLRQEWEQ